MTAALQVATAGGGRPRKTPASVGQRSITEWTTGRERTEKRHERNRAARSKDTGDRRKAKRKAASGCSGAGEQREGRDGVAALGRSTMREKD